MEINTNEPLNIITQLLIPIILIIITCVIQEPVKIYLSSHEKSQHIRILKLNFPSISKFFNAQLDYKIGSILCYFIFTLVGVPFGVYITEYLFEKVVTFLMFSNFNYIESISFMKNIGPTDIVLISFSCLNILTFVIFYCFPLYTIFLIPQSRFKPQLTSHGKIKWWLKYVYSFHWSFFGFIIGVNLAIYHLAPYIFDMYSLLYIEQEYSNISIIDLYTSMKTNLPYFQYIEALFVGGMLATILCFFFICTMSILISSRVTEKMADFYQQSFPYIKLKTGNGNIEGSLKDIQNKSLITLRDNNVLTIVPWDKIEIMEISYLATNEYVVSYPSSINDELQAEQEISH